jgi:hypothetical protein
MLQAPRKGFSPSVTKNNIKTEVLGDWLEANALFFDDQITKAEVVDFLREQEICSNQEVANDIADTAWNEIRRRKRISNIPDLLEIEDNFIRDNSTLNDDPIRAFFIGLSLFYAFPDWGTAHRNASVQGLLFEKVVEKISLNLLPGWETYRVGWSPETPASIIQIITDLSEKLNCGGHARLGEWADNQDKDKGLDLVCFRNFSDDREALPVYLLQCASGSNWRSKVNTPSPDVWQKFLDSAVRPGTGIAAPFVIPDKKLKVSALQGQAIVLDRLRLLSSYYSDETVIEDDLKQEIIAWMTPFVLELPVLV